jgi:UDPglucose 6-dehydrogenase
MADLGRIAKTSVEKTKIAVLGMGHVGLPTALGLAELGWEVIGADSNPETIATLKSGKSWFYEPDLEPLLKKHLESGLFALTDDVDGAIASATVLFVCVGTPQGDDGKADLTQVESIARLVARNLNGYKLIVEKSTVPAITAQWVKKTIARYARVEPRPNGASNGNGHGKGNGNGNAKQGKRTRIPSVLPHFDVASNPEFLQEGRAVENFFKPDRIVIGVESERARELLETIYRPLKCPIVVTNITTSELIKHAANAFLSTKISFINMVSDICEAVGADVVNVARGIGLDPRIGTGFLSAGIGFGGYCFPKDLRAFKYLGEEHGADCSLLKEVERINLKRIDIFLKKVRKALWVPQGKTIGVLGLAFKPRTDDIREAPALKIIDALLKEGASVRLYDPEAMPNAHKVLPEEPGRVTYCRTAYEAAAGAHALLLLTEWSEFKELDLHRVRDLMEVPVLVDGRNLYDPADARHAGFEYHSMGRDSAGHHLPVLATMKRVPRRKQTATLTKAEKAASKIRAAVN